METEVEIIVDENADKENKCKHKKSSRFETACGLLMCILFVFAIVVYLLIGFLLDTWHPTWVVFLAPIVITSIVMAIGKKNAKEFNYPVFIVMIYIIFSYLFELWHPLWVLFITIPIYYLFIKFISELKK